jgi:DNA-binding ferritin-like protein
MYMKVDIGIEAGKREQIANGLSHVLADTQRMQFHEKTAWMWRSLLE